MIASARSIADGVRAGRLDPLQIAGQAFDALERHNPALHAYLDEDRAYGLELARQVRERVRRGEDPGALAGVPVSLKDNIAVAGRTLTAGSRILEGYRSPYSSHVAERLLAAGAVLVGRTNLDEFAMGASTENSAWGPTKNPWDLARVPGGSSGGSAAAVAAGIVPVALGSETGGSIRQPAALCGVTGFKPTYGSVSRHGLVAFGSSLDVIGPLTAHAGDASLVYDVIAGHDPRDSTTIAGRPPAPGPSGLAGLRVALPGEYMDDAVDAGVRTRVDGALELLEGAGARVTRLPRGRLASTPLAIPVYYLVSSSEASSNLARFDGIRYGPRLDGGDLLQTYRATRAGLFGREVQRRIVLGTFALSKGYAEAWYQRALQVRRLILREFEQLFAEHDLLVGPTSPFPAFPLGEKQDDPYAMYLCDVLTAPACLAGLPSISVPAGLAGSLPVGLQITGPAGADGRVLAAAAAFEAARGEPERSPFAR